MLLAALLLILGAVVWVMGKGAAPFPPGGVADLTARPVTAAMEKALKQAEVTQGG